MCVAGGESDDGDAEVEVADGARELVVADMLGVAAAELAEAGLAPRLAKSRQRPPCPTSPGCADDYSATIA